jgi:hypothetical protein
MKNEPEQRNNMANIFDFGAGTKSAVMLCAAMSGFAAEGSFNHRTAVGLAVGLGLASVFQAAAELVNRVAVQRSETKPTASAKPASGATLG